MSFMRLIRIACTGQGDKNLSLFRNRSSFLDRYFVRLQDPLPYLMYPECHDRHTGKHHGRVGMTGYDSIVPGLNGFKVFTENINDFCKRPSSPDFITRLRQKTVKQIRCCHVRIQNQLMVCTECLSI